MGVPTNCSCALLPLIEWSRQDCTSESASRHVSPHSLWSYCSARKRRPLPTQRGAWRFGHATFPLSIPALLQVPRGEEQGTQCTHMPPMRCVASAAIGTVVGLGVGQSLRLSASTSAPRATTAPPPQPILLQPEPDWRAHRHTLRGAYKWAANNVPYFECSDPDISLAYYYRWRLFWLHLRETTRHGWVLTEFLKPVGWAGPYNTISTNAAAIPTPPTRRPGATTRGELSQC